MFLFDTDTLSEILKRTPSLRSACQIGNYAF